MKSKNSFFDCLINDEEAIEIIHSFQDCPSLERIHFSRNKLGDLAVKELANELRQNNYLTHI